MVTMTVGEWEKVVEGLKGEGYWPCGKLRELIATSVRKVSQQVRVTESDLT